MIHVEHSEGARMPRPVRLKQSPHATRTTTAATTRFAAAITTTFLAGCTSDPTPPQDASARSTTIGLAGGSVAFPGVTLTVPPMALQQPTEITITQEPELTPPGYTPLGHTFKFSPDDLVFEPPAAATFNFDGDSDAVSALWLKSSSSEAELIEGKISGTTITIPVHQFGIGLPINSGNPCFVSPTGDPNINFTNNGRMHSSPAGYDVAPEDDYVYAMADGEVLAATDRFGSWDCYSSTMCYGSSNCPCVRQQDGKYKSECKSDDHIYSGGDSLTSTEGERCYIEECSNHLGNCIDTSRACNNQISVLLYGSNGQKYLQRVLHISELIVRSGPVKAGDPIAKFGNVGWACSTRPGGAGTHAHVSIFAQKDGSWGRNNDNAFNWKDFIKDTCGSSSSGSGSGGSGVDGTCSDGLKNQGEERVDCGGPCPLCMTCTDGATERCWVECAQNTPAECLHIPPLLPGIRTCVGGQWGQCVTSDSCSRFGPGPCEGVVEIPTSYTCIDGTQKDGSIGCSKPFGVTCDESYFGFWPMVECSDLCTARSESGDTCTTVGETRTCAVHCNRPDGPIRYGTQECAGYSCDGAPFWDPCDTQKACLTSD
ncbi:hypothetical protein WMF04_29310 [Sorangium sp. So ce260]|uniref:hypothetical protein n=1 Tax=Sorangium sp. So ce260 TaxID=3133291 RepID=UPI003F63D42B